MLTGTRTVIGIDIGSHEIKVAELRLRRRRWRLEAARSAARPEDPDLLPDTIQSLLRGTSARARLVAGVPLSQSILKTVDLPPADPETLGQVLRMEAPNHVPFPAEQTELGHFPVGRARREGQRVLLGACHSDTLQQFRALLPSGRQVVLTISAMGPMVVAFRAGLLNPDSGVILLDLGSEGVDVLGVNRNIDLVARHVAGGCRALIGAVAEDLGLSEDDATDALRQSGALDQPGERTAQWLAGLQREINVARQAYRATARRQDIEQVLLSGGGALFPALREWLARSVDLPVNVLSLPNQLITPAGRFGSPEDVAPWVTAIGLAGAIATGRPLLNLLPGPTRYQVRQRRTRLAAGVLTAALVFALTVMTAYTRYTLSDHQRRVTELRDGQRILSARMDTLHERRNQAPIDVVERHISEARRQNAEWLDILRRLSRDLPAGVWLTELSADSGRAVTLKGRATESRLVAEVIEALRSEPMFSDVRLAFSSGVTVANKSVTEFQTICTLRAEESTAAKRR